MRKHLPIALAGAMALAGVTGAVAHAAPGAKGPKGGDVKNLPGFVKKWEGEKQAAADLVARGKKTPNAKGVVKLDNGRYVQHGLETTEEMTIALIDFSDLEHNTMPQPDRSKDNSTYWTPDFSVQHYKDMLFTPGGGSYGNPSLTRLLPGALLGALRVGRPGLQLDHRGGHQGRLRRQQRGVR